MDYPEIRDPIVLRFSMRVTATFIRVPGSSAPPEPRPGEFHFLLPAGVEPFVNEVGELQFRRRRALSEPLRGPKRESDPGNWAAPTSGGDSAFPDSPAELPAVQHAADPTMYTNSKSGSVDLSAGNQDSRKARLALAKQLVRRGGLATDADRQLVIEHLVERMTIRDLLQLQAAGIHILVTEGSVASIAQGLKGQRPRGYDRGIDWTGVSGTYLSDRKEVVIAIQVDPNSFHHLPGPSKSTSVDILLHELGHALNRRLGPNWARWLSDLDAFERACRSDANQGPLADKYFHQKPSGAGRDEAFAESYAMYFSQPSEMRRMYPHLYSYFEKLLARRGVD